MCVGRNYVAHASELGHAVEELPIIFFKNPAALCGAEDDIVIPKVCEENGPQVDYEGELAFILGCDVRDVSEAEAQECISGYAVANDVSARWWQKKGSGGQYCRGKSFDTFCPMSIPTASSSVSDPQNLRLVTRLNGDVVQDTSTSDMIFSISYLVSELSRGMTLLEGTVLLTGTPSGVGAAQEPKRFLREGDVVEVEIEQVGRICNRVVIE